MTKAAKKAQDNMAEKETVKGASAVIPRGRPKSGRQWKTQKTQRFSDFTRDPQIKTTWARKMKDRMEKKLMKQHEKELKERRSAELEGKRLRHIEQEQKKLENQKKCEVVQNIKNTSKVKRMKKKQLRNIQKRDTTKTASK